MIKFKTIHWIFLSVLLIVGLVGIQRDSVFNRSDICQCQRTIVNDNYSGINWCNGESKSRGNHQKVVSYSLYGNSSDPNFRRRYFSLVEDNARKIEKYYAGWVMRIYHNFSSHTPDDFCRIQCKFPHVDFCDVNKVHDDILLRGDEVLRNHLPDFRGVHPMIWRFYPIFDQRVEAMVSRDADSEILEREVSAVQQWFNSTFSFHVMRDHPNHHLPMLGGMWGVKLNTKTGDVTRRKMLKLVRSGQGQESGVDQDVLENVVWPIARNDVMAHDSYNCKLRKLLRKSSSRVFPFPTQRSEDKDFVGNVIVDKDRLRKDMKPCPRVCRPSDHQDWIYC